MFSYFFTILNMVRDEDYDLIPSYTIGKKDQLSDANTGYYEMKELQKLLSQASKQSASIQLGTEFVNDYGSREFKSQI